MYGITTAIKLIKGYKNSLLVNFNNKRAFEMETEDSGLFETLIAKKFFEKKEIELSLFSFLLENRMIYEFNSASISYLKHREEKFFSNSLIEYLTCTFSGNYRLEDLFAASKILLAKFLIIETDDVDLIKINNLLSQSSYPESVTIYTASKKLLAKENYFRVRIIENTKENFVNRDAINPTFPLYVEAQYHNTYFNKKMYIDPIGNVKNAKECDTIFTNIRTLKNLNTLVEIALSKDFQEFWNIRKDDCLICKDCEFRYSCVDNRVPTKNTQGSWSFDKDCSYDPYTAIWKEENG